MSINPHPTLPDFDYIKPASIEEASKFLIDHKGEARPLLGGTDIFIRLRDGAWKDRYLVDVKHLEGMKEIRFDPASGLVIGAAVNMNRVEAFPAIRQHYRVLADAARSCASYQLRTRATIVGNICNASPAGDTIGACMLLGGVLNVHGLDGNRQEPLATFFTGPGKTRLKPGDIATSLQFPLPPKGMVGMYLKHGRNQLSDLSIVGVTGVGAPAAELQSGYRIQLALASVSPVPLIVKKVEELLGARAITPEGIDEAGRIAESTCDPIDDVRGSRRYRSKMTRNLSVRALTMVWEELRRKQ
jgi:CO/xanthine dehydrogenase FAD-binding subunit